VKRLAVVVIAVFLFGAACSRPASDAAATVNGTPITTPELVDELNAIQANPDYITSLQNANAPGGTGLTVLGSTPGSFDAAFVSQVLIRQIDYSLIRAEMQRRRVTVDDACRRQARDDAVLNLGNGDAQTGQSLFDKFPPRYQDLLVSRNTDVIALAAALAGQSCGGSVDVQGYYDSHQNEFTKLCVSLIAVSDPTQADAIVAQARAGADFASLVRQFSVDPQSKANDGAIGCRLPSEFNPSVAQLLTAAKTGDVLDPLPGQNGVSIVKITDRQVAPLDEVRADVEQSAKSATGQAFSTWLQQARSTAQVKVDKRYGTFDPATFQINPPTIDLTSSAPPDSSSSSQNP
jgi:parvulin-like peptidyl-prolyl isomerase